MGWGVEPTTSDICSQSGAFDLSATATPTENIYMNRNPALPLMMPMLFYKLKLATQQG